MSPRPIFSPDVPQNDLADGFASYIVEWARQAGAPADSHALLAAAARLTSLATTSGHVCAQIDDLVAAFPGRQSRALLAQRLFASGMVAAADATALRQPVQPLVVDDAGRLYLYRYFDYERRLAANLAQRAGRRASLPTDALRQRLDTLFASNAARLGRRADWQKLAAALAWRGKLTVISGGPGTGKTTTVVALLACLLAENPKLRIAIAAPTGKAAARMLEALRKRAGDLPPELQDLLPRESHTLHRLLGVTPEAGRFVHDADNLLPIDALVIDEASMLDLALACRLCEAVPPDARLILLGDKDQLAAVEAGAVFAEVSADPTLSEQCIAELASLTSTPAEHIIPPQANTPGATKHTLADCVVWLSESHRFAATSGIGRLAAEINSGHGAAACEWLARGEDPSVAWINEHGAELSAATQQTILDGYEPYRQALAQTYADLAAKQQAVFAAFERFRVLCAARESARGVHMTNDLLAQHLNGRAQGNRSLWYAGRPVMLLRNNYILKLFNGDVGICLPNESGELMVWFPEHQSEFRPVAPIRLPEHDTAFAMTVHKSQGSEFNSVLLLLPEKASRLLSRELLYTGVTRAAQKITLIGSRETVISACANRTQRHSGLLARLDELA